MVPGEFLILTNYFSLSSVVDELYGTRYQSGSFSLINVGRGFHASRSFSFNAYQKIPRTKPRLRTACIALHYVKTSPLADTIDHQLFT